VSDARFGGGVGISGFAEPRALIDEALEAPGPLSAKFVNVVAAHLVDHEHDDKFGALEGFRHGWGLSGLGYGRDDEKYRHATKHCRESDSHFASLISRAEA
jgi:hypothetical protein